MFYYVYVFLSKVDGNFYVGYTSDLRERVKEHKAGEVPSTKKRQPLKLIFYEAFLGRKDAKRREKYLKTSSGRTTLRTMLKEFLGGNELG